MLDMQLHKFYISYRLNEEIHLEWVEGINLRHAKDKIEMKYEDASDLMDWTNESEEDLNDFLKKMKVKSEQQKLKKPEVPLENSNQLDTYMYHN